MVWTNLENQVLQEVLGLALVVVAGWLTLALSGATREARGWLEAHNQNAAANMLTASSQVVQTALDNEAGNLALRIKQGAISVSDLQQGSQLVLASAEKVEKKVPGSLAYLAGTPGGVAVGSIAEGITGKVMAKLGGDAMPSAPAPAVRASAMPKGDLVLRASWLKRHFMIDLDLKDFQAAGLVGNLAEESGLEAVQEGGVTLGRGGFGWGQWTGSRRTLFENWCAAKGYSQTEDDANYYFVLYEMRGPEASALAALRATSSLEEATLVVSEKYERPGTPRNDKRLALARQVMT